MSRPRLILVCGCSGAGKSTLAKRIAEWFECDHLDVDEYYKQPGTDARMNKFDAWLKFFSAIHYAEEHGIDCVVDSASLSASSRDEFINWFPSFEHHMVYVEANDLLRQKNNMSRQRHVPPDVMSLQSIRAERPVWRTMDKAWLSYTHVMNIENKYCVVQSEGDTFYESIKEISG